MIRPVLAWLAALLSTSILSAQEPAKVMKVRSLAPFASPATGIGSNLRTTALAEEEYEDVTRHPAERSEIGQVQWPFDLVQTLCAEDLDEGRLTVELLPPPKRARNAQPSLLLAGIPDAVAACERVLDRAAAMFGRRIVVDVYRLELTEGELPPTACSAETVRSLLASSPPLWHARLVTRSGGRARVGDERWIAYVRDVDVEVAENARMDDPKVDRAFAGVRAGLSVHALPNDRLLLEGDWLLSEHVAMHEQRSGGDEEPVLLLPEHRTAFLSFAGNIENGGALLVSGHGGEQGPDDFVLVVQARYDAPQPESLGPTVEVRDVSALTTQPPLPFLRGSFALPGLDYWPWSRIGSTSPRSPSPLVFWTTLQHLTGAAIELEEGVAVVTGTAETVAACRARIDQLLTDAAAMIEVRTEVSDGDGHTITVHQPAVRGRTVQAFVGWERAFIRDHEVEIASEAGKSNPVIGINRAGLWHRAAITGAGAPHVDGCWQFATQAPMRIHHHRSEPPATIQLPETSTTVLSWNAPMPLGKPHALGDAPPLHEGGPATRIFVELREK